MFAALVLNALSDLKQWIDPEFILHLAGDLALPIMVLIIFAETGLMIGFFLPGDSLLFIAGLFIAEGTIDPVGAEPATNLIVVMGSLIAAAIVGDQTGYVIGRKIGPRLFTRPKSFFFRPEYIEKTREFYDRHGGKTIIIGRFVPIIRTFAPVVAGVARLEYRKFVFYNITGGFLWIISMLSLGYFIGVQFKPYVKLITLGIIIISVLPVIKTVWDEWRKARRNKAAAEAVDKSDE